MSGAEAPAPPRAATEHGSTVVRRTGAHAPAALTVYLVLLVAVPSNLRIDALGALGKPALLWGLLLLLLWVASRLQRRSIDAPAPSQPLRVAYLALLVVVLIGFAAAMLRGQPADQVSPAINSLARVLSWGGVLLVALDGVRTAHDLTRMVRRLLVAVTALAGIGLVQFMVGSTMTEWMASIPGVSFELGGVDSRGAFTRASGTATHPLEFTAAVAGMLPLAIVTAIHRGYRNPEARRSALWVIPVGVILAAVLVSVSRSAVVGLGVAAIATLACVSRAHRWAVIGGIALATLVVAALVPGLFGTTLSLFTEAGSDPSALSRTNALERVPEFLATSPLWGSGFGTFLPRYYIFDNQWVLLALETGILGMIAFATMIVCAVGGAWGASRGIRYSDTAALSRALAASVLTIAVMFAFFDGLSFAIAAGLLFFVMGLCGAARAVAAVDVAYARRPVRAEEPAGLDRSGAARRAAPIGAARPWEVLP